MFTLLRWWVIFVSMVAGLVAAYVLDGFSYVLHADRSYLSVVTIVMTLGFTLWIGQLTYLARNLSQEFTIHLNTCDYAAETAMGLGMCGTLIGFLLLLKDTGLENLTTANTSDTLAIVSKMSSGFSTSATATLVGLICAILLKAQIVNLHYQVLE